MAVRFACGVMVSLDRAMVELGANTEVFINKEVVASFIFEVNGALFEVLTGK